MRGRWLWGVQLVVFDLAGTTVHDDGMVLECFVAAAGHVGLRVSRDELNDRMGASKRAVFDELARGSRPSRGPRECSRGCGRGA